MRLAGTGGNTSAGNTSAGNTSGSDASAADATAYGAPERARPGSPDHPGSVGGVTENCPGSNQATGANPPSTNQSILPSISGVRGLPRPALRWVGQAGRIALREFDFAADADVVCSFQEETYTLNFPDFRYTDSFAAAFRHDLRRASLDPHHGLFVLDEGQIVGFLWLVICENSWTGERYGYINNLYIMPPRRSLGLGTELMQQADDFFRSRRIKRARLTVTAANTAAGHLYQRCGYSIARWEMEKEL